ncbi:MAG: DNA repair protein RecN [Proteobacteria bacterium]|nr:DNA repair protein RecN [Pseudomonadota bacterium]
MLNELAVQNFALIESLRLSFGPGVNALTGETGAGKSIIVGAINLILGGRAAADLIRRGSDEAEVEALFVPEDRGAAAGRLDELGLPGGDEVLIRRVLSRGGRNRVYVNGSLATLAQLSTLGRDLVAVSGQHEHQRLLDPDYQLLLLDRFGRTIDVRSRMAAAHERMVSLKDQVRGLEADLREAREKAELYEFQVEEIRAAAPVPGEDEDLERERALARNAEKIFTLVAEAYERLYGERGAVIEGLDHVGTDLEKAAGLDERLEAAAVQVREAYHQLNDAAHVLRDHLDKLTFEPARLEEIEDRLARLNKLKRKYGPGLADVLNFEKQAAGRLDDLAELERRLEKARNEAEAARTEAMNTAGELSRRRRAAAEVMARAVADVLRGLGMPKVRFELAFEPRAEDGPPGPLGWDEVQYLISPNLGEELMPLARIASGGELSRAMLGLKSLLAGQDRVATVIFDEVDAGIGGAVAETVGRMLRQLAAFHQVICITHLPQLAVFADRHLMVFKEERGRRTVTDIRPLSEEERIDEVARLLGGAQPTRTSREAAREMIERARA